MHRNAVISLIEKSATKIAKKFHPYFVQYGWKWHKENGGSEVPTIRRIAGSILKFVKDLRKNHNRVVSGRIVIELYEAEPGAWDCSIVLEAQNLCVWDLEN